MPIIYRKFVRGIKGTPYLRPAFAQARNLLPKQVAKAIVKKGLTRENIVERIATEVKKVALFARERAREKAPKKTGNLARSINERQVGPMAYVVGTNVSYAAVQEFGHRKKLIFPVRAKVLRFEVDAVNAGRRGRRRRTRRRR